METKQFSLFFFSLLLFSIKDSFAWDSQELELFDLVEEVNANFYEVLGVDQSAPALDIRRAYRKLSVKLHPDKNKEEGAEERFRQIVAVYEVLKDETQRNRYNEILVNGLPDWRTPVYYYRKARKLGLLELAILLLVIITVGQFIVGWSMYFEKKYEMEEVFLSKRKKDKKGKKAKQAEKDVDDALTEYLETLPRPRLTDLVPCRLVTGLVSLVISAPTWVGRIKEWQEERRLRKEETSEEESETDETEERVKRPKRRQRVDIPELDAAMADGAPVVYLPEDVSQEQDKREDRTGKEWTDDEISLLAKAVAKFPSGTLNRWEKIAEFVGRSVSEVTAKSKSIKQKVTKSVDPASQGLTGSVNERVAFKKGQTLTDDISLSVDRGHVPPPAKVAATGGAATAQPTVQSDQWTQTQQKTLEWALSQYPKGTPERWDKIAEHITGKTKEECLVRFKHLAEVIRRKKEEAAIAAKR